MIEDKPSHLQFVTVKMDVKSFGEVLFGLGSVPIEFELQGIDRVGKKFEHKTVEVKVAHKNEIFPSGGDIDIAITKYEVDGWRGTRRDCENLHNLVRCVGNEYSVYKVSYCHWVDIEEKENGC